jgi:hypothetical protein
MNVNKHASSLYDQLKLTPSPRLAPVITYEGMIVRRAMFRKF